MPKAIARDGVGIHYQVVGEQGPWVVFIQGLSLSSRFWFDAPAQISSAFGARTIVLDNRGIGQSDAVKRPFSMRTMANDVAAVLDHAGCDKATIVGISMGGMIAQHVALEHPSRTEALVLLATMPGLPVGRWPGPLVLKLLAELPFAKGKANSAVAAKLLLPRSKQHRFDELFARWPAALAADPQEPRSFFLQLGAIAGHSTGARLGAINVPTEVIAGRADVLVPPVNSERIAARIAGASLELIDDVGHAVPVEDPTVVERAVRRVWTRLGR